MRSRSRQERSFERVGGLESIHVDVRIIAATNRNLEMAVNNGDFREDLYYRLNVIPVDVPPLRQRREDIPALAEHFLTEANRRLNRHLEGFSEEALEALREAPWRGNIRELENVVERAVLLADGPMVSVDDLQIGEQSAGGGNGEVPAVKIPPTGIPLEEIERQAVVEALESGATPDRGSFAGSREASRTLRRARRLCAGLLGGVAPEGLVFTLNATDALNLLQKLNYDVLQLRSKSWKDFAGPDAPSSTSFSRSVTMLPTRSARFGLDNP